MIVKPSELSAATGVYAVESFHKANPDAPEGLAQLDHRLRRDGRGAVPLGHRQARLHRLGADRAAGDGRVRGEPHPGAARARRQGRDRGRRRRRPRRRGRRRSCGARCGTPGRPASASSGCTSCRACRDEFLRKVKERAEQVTVGLEELQRHRPDDRARTRSTSSAGTSPTRSTAAPPHWSAASTRSSRPTSTRSCWSTCRRSPRPCRRRRSARSSSSTPCRTRTRRSAARTRPTSGSARRCSPAKRGPQIAQRLRAGGTTINSVLTFVGMPSVPVRRRRRQRVRPVPRRRRAARVRPGQGDDPQTVRDGREHAGVPAPGRTSSTSSTKSSSCATDGSSADDASAPTTSSSARAAPAASSRAGSPTPARSVILLEAGRRDNTQLVRKPGMIGPMHAVPQLKKTVDWGHYTVEQKHALGPQDPADARQGGRRLELDQRHGVRPRQPRRTTTTGRPRATPAGATTTCCPASSGSRRSRTAATTTAAAPGRSRSSGPASSPPASEAFIDALSETAGVKKNPDYNAAEQEGVSIFQQSNSGGLRYSAAVGYLDDRPAQPHRAAARRRSRASSSRTAGRPASRSSPRPAAR